MGGTDEKGQAKLGTSREVVSRILKDFESKGYVAGSRGHLEIKNLEALQAFRQ